MAVVSEVVAEAEAGAEVIAETVAPSIITTITTSIDIIAVRTIAERGEMIAVREKRIKKGESIVMRKM